MHVVNFSSDLKSYIRLGRGNDSDIRFEDISVSRIHAFIKKDPKDNSFYLEDNTSKFGTLV
jgi:pSer/pThr/pTyr-binding forkhead associated (FHA) protein